MGLAGKPRDRQAHAAHRQGELFPTALRRSYRQGTWKVYCQHNCVGPAKHRPPLRARAAAVPVPSSARYLVVSAVLLGLLLRAAESPYAAQVYVCRSGSAADTQNLASYVQLYLHQHQVELGGDVSVRTAARLAQQIVYNNKVRRIACRAQGFVQGAGPLSSFQTHVQGVLL